MKPDPKRMNRKSSATLLAGLYVVCTIAIFVFAGVIVYQKVLKPATLSQKITEDAQAVQSETVQPRAAQSETVQSQAVQSETILPQTTHSETVQPQGQNESLLDQPIETPAINSGLFQDGSDDPDGYLLPQSRNSYLSEEDLSNLTLKGLCYAKNEIYARHGRKFKAQELQDYFDRQVWYFASLEASDETDQKIVSQMNEFESFNKDVLAEAEAELGGYSFD